MNNYSFESDSKFNVTAAILLLATFSVVGLWIVISGLTKDIGTITSITGAFRMWGLWLVIFAILLISPVARIIVYYAQCIKEKQWADDTKGVELTSLGVVIGVLLVGIGIPKIIHAVGGWSGVSIFSEATYQPLIISTIVVVAIWFGLFVTGLILSIIADAKYIKSQKKIVEQIEKPTEATENELS